MNHLTPETEQREYVERCKKTTEELLKERDDRLRASGVFIPQYERGDA